MLLTVLLIRIVEPGLTQPSGADLLGCNTARFSVQRFSVLLPVVDKF